MRILDQWVIVTGKLDCPFKAPEQTPQFLAGRVEGQHFAIDLESLLGKEESDVIVFGSSQKDLDTHGKIQLGEPLADYEAQFSGARDRLLNALSAYKLEV